LKATASREGFFLIEAVRILSAIVCPPLAVYLTAGLTGEFWLNLLLTVLGYVPGMVHAIWLLTTRGG
jgi:uncharacterized membrane protein YqaE (UPF0057 family)